MSLVDEKFTVKIIGAAILAEKPIQLGPVFGGTVTERLVAVHQAQLLTYLRLTKIKIGLPINFNEAVLKDGVKRMVL